MQTHYDDACMFIIAWHDTIMPVVHICVKKVMYSELSQLHETKIENNN